MAGVEKVWSFFRQGCHGINEYNEKKLTVTCYYVEILRFRDCFQGWCRHYTMVTYANTRDGG